MFAEVVFSFYLLLSIIKIREFKKLTRKGGDKPLGVTKNFVNITPVFFVSE